MKELIENAEVGGVLHLGAGASLTTAAGATVDLTGATVILPPGSVPAPTRDQLPVFIGDVGKGGQKGAVPAPAAGDGAAGRFLSAGGVWLRPPGGGADDDTVDSLTHSDDFNAGAFSAVWTDVNQHSLASLPGGGIARVSSYPYTGDYPKGINPFAQKVDLYGQRWKITAKVRVTPGNTAADGATGGIFIGNPLSTVDGSGNGIPTGELSFCWGVKKVGGNLKLVTQSSTIHAYSIVDDAPPISVDLPAGTEWVWLRLDGQQNVSYSLDGNAWTVAGQPGYGQAIAVATGGAYSLSLVGNCFVGLFVGTNNASGDHGPAMSIDADFFQVETHTNPSAPNPPAVFVNPMTTLGDLIVGGVSGAPQRLAPGANGKLLVMYGGAPTWATVTAGFDNPMTTPGDLITGGAGGAAARLPKGSEGQVLKIVGGVIVWAADATGGGTGGGGSTTLAGLTDVDESTAPTDGQALVYNSASSKWKPGTVASGGGGSGLANPMTAAGDLIVGGAAGAPARLGKGADGQILQLAGGVPLWATPTAAGASSNVLTYASDGDANGAVAFIGKGYDVGNAFANPVPSKMNVTTPNGLQVGSISAVTDRTVSNYMGLYPGGSPGPNFTLFFPPGVTLTPNYFSLRQRDTNPEYGFTSIKLEGSADGGSNFDNLGMFTVPAPAASGWTSWPLPGIGASYNAFRVSQADSANHAGYAYFGEVEFYGTLHRPPTDPTTTAGDITYRGADGLQHRLGIGAAGQILTVVAGLPAWLNRDGSAGILLTFSAFGDTNGMFYHIGQKAGFGTWVNPSTITGEANKLPVTINGTPFTGGGGSSMTDATNRSPTGTGEGFVINEPGGGNAWVTWDLGANRTFKPNYVAFQQRPQWYVSQTNLKIQGSNDNVTYDDLATIMPTQPGTGPSDPASAHWDGFAISGVTTAYRYLRVRQNDGGTLPNLTIGEIEFYGNLTKPA